ncbi:hypothetical protein T484DRAFT_1943774 [Baffinella frigidus]|nr:hypothetical protein T484DRAFT_1943774 [Cryptophyta sp. CCMP2293]
MSSMELEMRRWEAQRLESLELKTRLLEEREAEIAEKEEEIQSLQRAMQQAQEKGRRATEKEINRLSAERDAETALAAKAASLAARRLAEQDKVWRGVLSARDDLWARLAARDNEQANGRRATEQEIERLRGAWEEQKKRGQAFYLESHEALAARDAQIQQLVQANHFLLAGWDAAGARLAAKEEEHREAGEEQAPTVAASEAALAGKDGEIARLGRAKGALEKELAGLRKAGERSTASLAFEEAENKRLRLEKASAESAHAQLAGKETQLLLSTQQHETAIAAKDGEIARLGLAGEEQAKEVAGLRRAGEEAGGRLRAREERARAELAAKDAELRRVRREQEAALAVKDGVVARLRRGNEEQAGALQDMGEKLAATDEALAETDTELVGIEKENVRLRLAAGEQARTLLVERKSARVSLATKDGEIVRLGLAGEEATESARAELAAKEDEVVRLGLAGEEREKVVAGLRRAGEEAGGEARVSLAAKAGEVAALSVLRDKLLKEGAGHAQEVAGLRRTGEELAKVVVGLRRAGKAAGKAGEEARDGALASKEAQIVGLRREKEQEKQEAEEGLEESRETLGYQIRATDSLMTKVDDLVALALAGGADAAAVTAIKLRSLC